MKKTKTVYYVDLVDTKAFQTIVSVYHSEDSVEAYKVAEEWNKGLNNPQCIYYTEANLTAEVYEVEEEIEEVMEMKKYTIDNYEEFSKNALAMPPIEQFEDGSIDEAQWYKDHMIHITVGNHDIELDYHADNVNEIDSVLKEMYEVEKDYKYATTGNTVGSEYPNATWKDILRFAALDGWYEDSHTLEAEVDKCIRRFTRARFEEVMKKIEDQTSMNDELEVNFFKLDTKGLWKIFDEEERRQAFKEILCSKIEISELVDEEGRADDKVVIMDYSIVPSGNLVGWHYGVDFDKNSEVNQDCIQDYINWMTK